MQIRKDFHQFSFHILSRASITLCIQSLTVFPQPLLLFFVLFSCLLLELYHSIVKMVQIISLSLVINLNFLLPLIHRFHFYLVNFLRSYSSTLFYSQPVRFTYAITVIAIDTTNTVLIVVNPME